MRRQLELNEVLRVGKRGSDLRKHAGFALQWWPLPCADEMRSIPSRC